MSLLDLDSLDVTWVKHVCMFIAYTRAEWSSAIDVVHPLEGGATEAGGYSTSNLTLILALGFCPVQMPDSDNDHLMEKLQF